MPVNVLYLTHTNTQIYCNKMDEMRNPIKRLNNSQLFLFINTCTVCYDEYDYYSNTAALNDIKGDEIASLNFDNHQFSVQPTFYINDHEYITTSKNQHPIIINYIESETEIKRASRLDAMTDDYDVRAEQGLYTYGY